MEQMHAFAAAAARERDADRDEPTELERWRAVCAEPMIRLLSDSGLRFGELTAVGRAGLRPGWLRVKTVAHQGEVLLGTQTTHHKPEDEQWRDIPLPASTEAMLRALPARIDKPLLLTTATGKVWRERNWRRDVSAPTCKGDRHGPTATGVPGVLGVDPRRCWHRSRRPRPIRRAQRRNCEQPLRPTARPQRRAGQEPDRITARGPISVPSLVNLAWPRGCAGFPS
jgi:hypothetical protein